MQELHLDFGSNGSGSSLIASVSGEILRKQTIDVASLEQTCALCEQTFPVVAYHQHLRACLGFNPDKENQLRFPFPLSA